MKTEVVAVRKSLKCEFGKDQSGLMLSYYPLKGSIGSLPYVNLTVLEKSSIPSIVYMKIKRYISSVKVLIFCRVLAIVTRK